MSIFHTWMYVSSCKSVDIRIDIFKYEEGFFIVVKIIEKEISITNVSVKVRSNYNWIEWFSGVFGKVCLPVSICKRWLLTLNLFSVFFCDLYWWLCTSNHFCDCHFWILSRILVSCYFLLDYIGVTSVPHAEIIAYSLYICWGVVNKFFSAISFDICKHCLE